jgi:putative transposase
MRTYEFRLYPNREQRRRLISCLSDSRQLYNEMLERQKQYYQETSRFLSRYDLQSLFKGRGGTYVPASTVQCLAARLDNALRTFLLRRKEGWGFPRFKSLSNVPTMEEAVSRSAQTFGFSMGQRAPAGVD